MRSLPTDGPPPCLIDWIDFKWLMAGVGHRVSVERLQQDPGYALQALALAEGSDSATLRWVAQRLLRGLLASQPVAPA